MQALLSAALLTLATTWVATLGLRRLAAALGLMDHPGGHKQHADPVPAVGGLAIALGLAVGLCWLGVATIVALAPLLIAAMLLLLVGLIDDRRGLSPRLRFAVQALAALAMALFGGVRLDDFGLLLGGSEVVRLGWLSLPLTVFCVVGLINACNMSDGHDGVAASQVALALWAVAVLGGGDPAVAALAPLLLAAVLGFLLWNAPWRSAARAYLGDAGSLLLGGLLAALLVRSSQGAEHAFEPVVALWLYALPLIDTVSVMWRRLAAGRPMFAPDQRHLHHVLARAGLAPRTVWLAITAIALAFAMVGIVAARGHWPAPWLAVGYLTLAMAYHARMRRADAR